MLRVGLTGGLGSGKSTVAGFLRNLGAEVIESDELGRAMMEPGQQVYAEIVSAFGQQVVSPDGRLNRAHLAKLAFEGGRLNELNAIVHPAVIEAQRLWMDEVLARDPAAVAVVESALIFEVVRDARARGESESVLADWRHRIDRIIVVTAPDELKIARYAARISPSAVGRAAVEADARLRLAFQIPDAVKAPLADYVLENTGDIAQLHSKVVTLWSHLNAESNKFSPGESLK
ncbi:MAG: dephospho-CoA kinase [Candidatus Korobacteraceae bacterium]